MLLPNPLNKKACREYDKYLTIWAWTAISGIAAAISVVVWIIKHFENSHVDIARNVAILMVVVFVVMAFVLTAVRLTLNDVTRISGELNKALHNMTHEAGCRISKEEYFEQLYFLQEFVNWKVSSEMHPAARKIATSHAVGEFRQRYVATYGPVTAS